MEERFSRYVWLYFPLLIVFTLDRLTKSLALNYLTGAPTILIPGWLSLRAVSNQGIAFGIFSTHGSILVLLISIVLLIALFAIHNIPQKYYLPAGLVLGGAFGNVFDRFVYAQGVVDFISVPFFSVFNIADIAITCGIVILVVSLFLAESRNAAARPKKLRRRRA